MGNVLSSLTKVATGGLIDLEAQKRQQQQAEAQRQQQQQALQQQQQQAQLRAAAVSESNQQTVSLAELRNRGRRSLIATSELGVRDTLG